MTTDPTRRLPVLALAVGFAIAAVEAATPHMPVTMDCAPDCGECLEHCCCPPAPSVADAAALEMPGPGGVAGLPGRAVAEPSRRPAPRRGHPVRGPPA